MASMKKADHEALLHAEKVARKNAEQQARIREHFIAIASHELKSPITSQKAYLQLLTQLLKKNGDLEYLPYIKKIEGQTDKLTSFINDLLDVSKMKSKKFHYKMEHFKIDEALHDALEQVHNLLIKHKVLIKGKVDKTIIGDKERITQVLTNLISNAVKYSPNADTILIHLAKENKQIKVSIRDFGIGIAKEHQERIFNRFYRIAGTNEKTFKGFGLGLYLTAEIIKKHKGKIWVESVDDKGSTFIFTLPFTR